MISNVPTLLTTLPIFLCYRNYHLKSEHPLIGKVSHKPTNKSQALEELLRSSRGNGKLVKIPSKTLVLHLQWWWRSTNAFRTEI